jgi:flagellar biosynthesis protein FlhG
MPEGQRTPKGIWAIGGGKGGTGKTLIASNMAIYLAQLGQKVLLVDADLGGGNLHTCLGIDRPRNGIWAFLEGGRADLLSYVQETGIPNLSLLTGGLDSGGRLPTMKAMDRLRRALRESQADYVILDVGSGTSPWVMTLFLMGRVGIYVIVPEPTSLENVYLFLREVLFFLLGRASRKRSVRQAVQQALFAEDPNDSLAVPSLLDRIERLDPAAVKGLRSVMEDFCVHLVLNQVRRYDEVEIGFSARSAIRKYFGVRVDFVGYINHDERVMQCVRMRKPLIQNFPDSNAAKCIENLTNKLLTHGQLAFDFF